MAKKMKKFQIARPYQSYEYMDVPDNFSVRCPDGSTIDMEITEVHGNNGERFTYEGENPFVSVYIDYGLGGARYFESEEPQSTSAYITVFCERTAPNGYDYWNDKDATRRVQLDNSPSIDEIISKTEGLISEIWEYALNYAKIEESAKKSKKVEKMAKNDGMKKSINDLLSVYDNLSTEEKDRIQAGLDEIGTGFWVRNLLAGEYSPEPEEEYDDDGYDDDDYEASAKKSMNKSKYSDIQKRLAKLGGFTKEDDDDEDDDEEDDDIGDDSARWTGVPADWEEDDEDDDDDEDDADKGCKSKKTVKGMKRMKMRKEDDDGVSGKTVSQAIDGSRHPGSQRNNLSSIFDEDDDGEDSSEKYRKSRKTKKAEDMPSDADDFKEDNQKGTGNAGSELPEDADDNQDQNEKGSGNAGSELPEDADDQQDIKESARKSRIARMQRATKKSVNRPPVKKFSVTNGGSPDQTSYNGRYQQSPMVRDAIDGHFGSKTEKFNEVDMMNERINDLIKSRRNPVSNNGVPKRIH